ncbi:MATE family efflux transporter [Devosia rhodophyticola]|uniref:Multidrug-efflux transporter n=1 Tax=Devosia rhodophyticola TaxID=3026423 RepID=A0ABY7YWR0_9HYPH|nr:MATE family efflux transporter [Devosia rhodophyticola]WDR05364.1 MATE family efflux transporter [Devosia rhodophyticola]
MDKTTTAAPSAAALAAGRRAGWLRELRETFTLAWPLVIAQVAQNALITTDVIMMGWLGPKQLAAGTLASTFIMPFLVGAVGLISAIAPLVAQARGARNIRAVRRIVRQGFWATIILSALLIPLILQVKPIFLFLGQNPETTMLAEQYIQIGVAMFIPGLAVVVLRSMLSAFNTTRIILVLTLAAVVVNAIGDYLLMFGVFGLPRLELRGAAIATVVTNLFMFVVFLAYVLNHKRFRRFHILWNFWKPDWHHLAQIFRIGTPIGMTVLAEVGLFTAAALLMGLIGTNEIAAHAIAMQSASMAFMVPLGLGVACTVRVGYAYGRGDDEGVRKAGWTALGLSTAFMTVSCITFILGAPLIVTIFLDPDRAANTDALRLGASYLVVAGLFQLVDGAQVVAAHALRGLSDTKVPMLVAIVSYWFIGLPIAYVMGFTFNLQGVGIWLGLAAGLAFAAIVLVIRFAMRERLGLLRRTL